MKHNSAIEETAARWAGLRSSGMTSEQEQELAAWLDEDDAHREALARMEGVARSLDRLAVLRPLDGSVDPDFQLGRVERRIPLMPVIVGLAAALAIAYLGVTRAWFKDSYSQTAETAIGDSRDLDLPDGSKIVLNTDSSVRINYSSTARRVELVRGEAFFTVAKNASRPFLVSGNGVVVKAIGTAFNVRLKAAAVEVLVTEGRVGVSSGSNNQLSVSTGNTSNLAPAPSVVARGEIAIVPVTMNSEMLAHAPLLKVSRLTEREISRSMAWAQRKLVFDPTPLREIVAEFNRYNRQRLVVADPAIAETLIGGSFDSNDPEALARLLETGFEMAVERHDGEIRLRSKR